MKDIIKFAIWVVILIAIFKVAVSFAGAIFGSMIGLAVMAILIFLIYRSLTS